MWPRCPTYGIIDKVISTSGTPYSALHDIDANKPGGSIRIRVRTYAHSLSLHEEGLEDQRSRKEELKKRLAAKRAELELKFGVATPSQEGPSQSQSIELPSFDAVNQPKEDVYAEAV
jgi:hypothetical protein